LSIADIPISLCSRSARAHGYGGLRKYGFSRFLLSANHGCLVIGVRQSGAQCVDLRFQGLATTAKFTAAPLIFLLAVCRFGFLTRFLDGAG
jgi:hypothetical protein